MGNFEDYKRPEWQRKRLEILQRDNFLCCYCAHEGKTLHVHHRYYISKRNLWDYPNWAYVTLCDDCHKLAHEDPEIQDDWESAVQFLETKKVDQYQSMSSAFRELAEAENTKDEEKTIKLMTQMIISALLAGVNFKKKNKKK